MKYSKLLYTAALALAPCFCSAQLAFNAPSDGPVTAASAFVVKPSPSTPVATPSWQAKFDRWVNLKEFDYAMRYRSVTDANHVNEFDQGQQRSVVDGKFNFDEQGKYGMAFHASSGKSFNWSYADFMGGGNEKALTSEFAAGNPVQQGTLLYIYAVDPTNVDASKNSGGWSFYMRRLYLDLEPVKGIEFQGGSLDIDRGAASEITTYDNDGYIDGERILIKRPKQLFFDEASVTYAYFGDLYKPNMFARMDRFTQSNYHQFLLRKNVTRWVDASVDYTWQDAANIMHEDAFIKVPASKVLDSVRVEFYQRPNRVSYRELKFYHAGGDGFAVTVDKKAKRLLLEGGVADIDLDSVILTQVLISGVYGLGVNGDQYGIGKRFFVRPSFKLTPYLEAGAFYTHAWGGPGDDPNIIMWNRQAFNAGFNFDMKKLLFPTRVQ